MNFISALFHKRTITKAFNAVDNDNVAELAALKIDPNTTRKAVLEKYTFEWEENLLSRAVRNDKYNAALYLLDNGANPYSHDDLNNDLGKTLRTQASYLIFQNEQLVRGDAHGKIAGALSNPETDYRLSPLLTTLVALEYQRRAGQFEERHGVQRRLDESGALRLPSSPHQVQQWLDVQVPRYEAHRLTAALDNAKAAASSPKKL